MKKILALIILFIVTLIAPINVSAANNPRAVPNNIFGIHITNENDLKEAASLVNSADGDWGYVTFVITESERDYNRWQNAFDEARRLHLIPIVRVASKLDGENWTVPQYEEINNWIAFLNSLNWVIENRYVIIGNEPNHAKEWGGNVNPDAYAKYLSVFSQKLHEASSDFFVLPAGMDASCKNTKITMDESMFIRKMLLAVPDLFDDLDGWTSHSYPNPDFAGEATDTGKGSIATFVWELDLLHSLEVYKDLPVFITETGWSTRNVDPGKIAEMYEYAFQNVWDDKRITAVTPFILNYKDNLFSEFSWRKDDGSYFTFYDKYKNISKIKGKPIQHESGQIIGALAQPVVFTKSDFVGAVWARNTGQTIWNTDNVNLVSDAQGLNFKNSVLFDIEPIKSGLIVFKANSEQDKGVFLKSIYLANKEGKRITNSFPIEFLIVKGDKEQMQNVFVEFAKYLQNSFSLNFVK